MKHLKVIGLLAVAGALLFISKFNAQAAETEPREGADADRQACIAQLERIHEAIQAYRRDHKELPNWLSVLTPKYIENADDLVCPITKRSNRTHAFEHLKDPKMPQAYLYEFSMLPMGSVWAGGEIRMRDFKRRQMGLVGGEVPIVRCHLHSPVINLGFNGHIYDSNTAWEEKFNDVVDYSAWQIDNLFPDIRRTIAARPQPAPEAQESGPQMLVGKAAPDFSLPLLEGGTFDLGAQKGKKVVLLDFWATWCGPCRVAMPALVEISKEYADKGVQYYAVNLREQPETIRGYLKDSGLNIAVPLDKDGSIAKKYAVRGIPTMVIVGKDGEVKRVHVGSSPNLKSELSRALDEIVSDSSTN